MATDEGSANSMIAIATRGGSPPGWMVAAAWLLTFVLATAHEQVGPASVGEAVVEIAAGCACEVTRDRPAEVLCTVDTRSVEEKRVPRPHHASGPRLHRLWSPTSLRPCESWSSVRRAPSALPCARRSRSARTTEA